MLSTGPLLVATDFSEAARPALRAAAHLAHRLHRRLLVLHIVEAARTVYEDDEDQQRQVREQMDALLRDAGLPAELDVELVVRAGYVAAEGIVEEAQREDAALVVVGTHGRRGLRKWLLGSVAAEVARTAHGPVLTVRPDAEASFFEGAAVRPILAPIDFSDASLAALGEAAALAEALDAPLHVVHVMEDVGLLLPYGDVPAPMTEAYPALRERAEQSLGKAVAALPQPERVAERHLVNGRSHQAIVHAAEEQGVGLVVMATSGRSGIERALLGSTAERVLERAPCPVLLLREREEA